MRQAGRCLAEYRALRERHGILEIARNPELCARVTRMPVDRLGVDAAVLYADIMLPLDGMGVPFHIEADLGPIVERVGELWTMRLGCLSLVIGCAAYPIVPDLWILAAFVMPLVPIGTALLFPSTTSLLSGRTPSRELGTVMGVAQTFAGLARVAAPLIATAAFQRLGHPAPFFIAGGIVALVGLLAFRVEVQPPTLKAAPAPAPASETTV